MGISDFASKVIGDKRRWWEYKARTRRLPKNHRTAVDAIERYLMHVGPAPADADSAASMFETSPICSSRPRRTERRSARSSGRTLWSSSRRSFRTTRRAGG